MNEEEEQFDAVTQALLELAEQQPPPARIVGHDDYLWDAVSERYIDIVTGAGLVARSVDGSIPRDDWFGVFNADGTPRIEDDEQVRIRPSNWLMAPVNGRVVYGRTWWPEKPKLIPGFSTIDGSLTKAPGMAVYNEYVPPPRVEAEWEGDFAPYLNHITQLFPDEAERGFLLDRFAYIIQFPGKKINGLCVIHGPQGGGKDTLFVPLHNWLGTGLMKTLKGSKAAGRFNSWVRSLLTVIVETSSRETSSVELYESLKDTTASPPLFLGVERKGVDQYEVLNCVSLFTTTNHPFALYMEDDDRRLWMLHAARRQDEWPEGYFKKFYAWMNGGGWKAVIHWLSRRDLSAFNPAENAKMTESKQALAELITNVHRTPLDDALDNYLEKNDNPDIIITGELRGFIADEYAMEDGLSRTLDNLVFSKSFPHKMRERGYYGIGKMRAGGRIFTGIYVINTVKVKHQKDFAYNWIIFNRCEGDASKVVDLTKFKTKATAPEKPPAGAAEDGQF